MQSRPQSTLKINHHIALPQHIRCHTPPLRVSPGPADEAEDGSNVHRTLADSTWGLNGALEAAAPQEILTAAAILATSQDVLEAAAALATSWDPSTSPQEPHLESSNASGVLPKATDIHQNHWPFLPTSPYVQDSSSDDSPVLPKTTNTNCNHSSVRPQSQSVQDSIFPDHFLNFSHAQLDLCRQLRKEQKIDDRIFPGRLLYLPRHKLYEVQRLKGLYRGGIVGSTTSSRSESSNNVSIECGSNKSETAHHDFSNGTEFVATGTEASKDRPRKYPFIQQLRTQHSTFDVPGRNISPIRQHLLRQETESKTDLSSTTHEDSESHQLLDTPDRSVVLGSPTVDNRYDEANKSALNNQIRPVYQDEMDDSFFYYASEC